jgi:hypothetical protein
MRRVFIRSLSTLHGSGSKRQQAAASGSKRQQEVSAQGEETKKDFESMCEE